MKTVKEPKKRSKTDHMTVDVVCGMDVSTRQSHHHVQYGNTVYHFCSSHCKQHFVDAPERYVWEK